MPNLYTCVVRLLIVAAAVLIAAGCGGGASHIASQTAPATPAEVVSQAPPSVSPSEALPSGATEPTPASTESPSASSAPSATPSAAATQNPNLLSLARGTFVRRWTVGASTYPAESLPNGGAWVIDEKFSGTPELVFELPALAHIAQVAVVADLPSRGAAQVHVATATANDRAFTDAGTIALSESAGTAKGSLQSPILARWLRVRIDRPGGENVRIESIAASGDVALSAQKFSGRWALADSVEGADAVFGGVKGVIPTSVPPLSAYQMATLERDGSLIAATCTLTRDVWRGPIEGGSATLDGGGSLSVVAGGSLLIGVASTEPILARRIARAATCDVPPAGRGPIVATIARYPEAASKFGAPSIVPGYRYETFLLPLLSGDELRRASVAVLAMSCTPTKDTAPWQQQALLDFVRSGHVLIVRDADVCTKSEYGFIPYPFTTTATGAAGARGSVLSIADSSPLAAGDASDRQHYVDTVAYLKNTSQQIGDADIMRTDDNHWCGLMFAKNAAGASGWIRAYARYGKGVIVYDGFDEDDLRSQIPQAVALSRLAYSLSPSADLPCNAHVASQLIVLSSVHRAVAFGRERDLHFAFTVDQEGATAPQRITLSLAGERAPGWRASVDRRDFTLGASENRVNVVVHVPANATATRHLYTLTATGAGGQSAQASIELDINEALAKELEKGGRARIYGIHFDVASARIQPQSEPMIREIGLVLRSHPGWRMRVEGHTDSDGGAVYNLSLSRRRAQSVVNDLVAHYRIARARLKAVGYGLSRPVGSNATEAGKALNRRVELVRL